MSGLLQQPLLLREQVRLSFHNLFFLVNTGSTKTIVCFPSLILRCPSHRWPGLDWPGSTERRLDHSLGKLEPSANSVVFSGWLADRIPSLDVWIKRERPIRQNFPRWRWSFRFQLLRFETRREGRQPAFDYKPSLMASRSSVGLTHPRCRQHLRLHDRLLHVLL